MDIVAIFIFMSVEGLMASDPEAVVSVPLTVLNACPFVRHKDIQLLSSHVRHPK